MRKPTQPHRPIRVCYPFIGNSVGGSHVSTLALIKNIDRSKIEPLIVLHQEGPLAGYVRQQGLNFELFSIPRYFEPPYWSLRNVSALIRQTGRIAAFIRNQRIDLVHANDVRVHFGWTLATRLAGARLIWHQRTGTFGRSAIKLFLALLSHQVVCISRYVASTLPRPLNQLICVVDNPFETAFATLDRSEARSTILRELGLAPDARLIGFFGNLVQQKRPYIFLQTAAEIAKHEPTPFAFLLFGAERGNALAELSQLAAELGISSHVHFMGFRTPIEPWIGGCDLIVAPGVGEGLGRTLVEAMIVGTPVVAADSGGHRDVIANGENGLLASADDPIALAGAAIQFLDNPALAAEIANHARAEAIRRYSIDHHVANMERIYMDGLNRSHRLKVHGGSAEDSSIDQNRTTNPR